MAALNPPPMVVELVIGYAPDPWLIRDSTHTTASAPSQVVGMPGYWNLRSTSPAAGTPETRSSVPVAMRRLLPVTLGCTDVLRVVRRQWSRTGLPAPQHYLIY